MRHAPRQTRYSFVRGGELDLRLPLPYLTSFERVRRSGRWGTMIPGTASRPGRMFQHRLPDMQRTIQDLFRNGPRPDPSGPLARLGMMRGTVSRRPCRYFFLPAIGFALPLRVRA